MGIRTRNLQNAIIHLKAPGTVTAAADKDVAVAPFDGFITNIFAKCTDGGSGVTNSIADVNYQGTSIFGSDAVKLTFASTTGVVSYGAVSSSSVSVTAGGHFTLDVDSISTSPKTSRCISLSAKPR